MKLNRRVSRAGLVLLCSLVCGVALADEAENVFVIRTTSKSPEAVVTALKSYSETKKWLFLGADKIKNGEFTLVKVCIPEVGKLVWPQGPQMSALLPCGNLGIYLKGGKTEISMLHASYMHRLVPTAAMKKVSDTAEPLLEDMLNTALK